MNTTQTRYFMTLAHTLNYSAVPKWLTERIKAFSVAYPVAELCFSRMDICSIHMAPMEETVV